jgi:glycosyltransferase involved in cell wall biosynthesis
MTTLSIISAVYNKAAYLPALLENLRAQGVDAEFVFADDASTDGSGDWLAAQDDPRIRVIRNAENAGPAIRLNHAAALARGEWLLPVDADDRLSGNAAATFLGLARAHDADLIFARSERGVEPSDLPDTPDIAVSDDPLLMAAMRKIVRMGYLARASVWRDAGGADEQVFVQDQSLPLRLGMAAGRAVYVEHTAYWLSAQEAGSLSRNTLQQHHDRYRTMTHMLARDLPADARWAIEAQRVSAWWKMHREAGGGRLDALPAYLANRLTGRGMSPGQIARADATFAALSGVRRPEQ